MILAIFVFILILRSIFWIMVVYKTSRLQKAAKDREARNLIATQKFSALSILLEAVFWFLLIVPNTPISILDSEIAKSVLVILFSLQLIPATFVWMWWQGLIEGTESTIEKFQNLFYIVVSSAIIVGIFTVIYSVLSAIN